MDEREAAYRLAKADYVLFLGTNQQAQYAEYVEQDMDGDEYLYGWRIHRCKFIQDLAAVVEDAKHAY